MAKRLQRIQPRQSGSSIPDDVISLFGAPSVLGTEDAEEYWALLRKVAEVIKPKNTLEWIWANDVVYHSWNIRRLRHFKALIIEEERSSLADEDRRLPFGSAIEARRKSCPAEEVDTGRGLAVAFQNSISVYERIDRLLESAERRRNTIVREIQQYREGLAHLLEEASNKIIEAEYTKTAA
jgi:hypothetical protein